MPLRTSFDGPASITKEQDIIDEAFDYFRVNVLFSSYEIKSGADVVLIYLLVMIGHLFKITDNEYDFCQNAERPMRQRKREFWNLTTRRCSCQKMLDSL